MTGRDVAVSRHELWTMLLCTVRYALGRRTYVVAEACDLVTAFRGELQPEQVGQLAREVADELARAERDGRTVGMEMDHRRWAELVAELRAPARRSAPC